MTKPPSHKSSKLISTTTRAAPARGGKAPVRSENLLLVPHYKPRAPGDPGPPVAEVLRAVGLQRTRVLEPAEMRGLVKAPLDITNVADQAVEQYARDHAELGLKDFPPELLRDLFVRVQYLKPRAAALEEAATIALHQTMVAASDLQDALLRIRRRLLALSQEDPEILKAWQPLLDFFERLYKGRGPGASEPPAPAESSERRLEPVV